MDEITTHVMSRQHGSPEGRPPPPAAGTCIAWTAPRRKSGEVPGGSPGCDDEAADPTFDLETLRHLTCSRTSTWKWEQPHCIDDLEVVAKPCLSGIGH